MRRVGTTRSCRRWAAGLAAAVCLGLLSAGQVKAQPPSPRAEEARTVEGKVKSFTTAPRGEVDGAVLDDGTVIHWPPHLEDRFRGILSRGDRVRVTGREETGPEGDTHLEVRSVTNLRTRVSRENSDDAPPPPPRGPRPPRRRGPAPRLDRQEGERPGPEERIRALEEQVEQLKKEVERLRRDR